MPYFVQRMLRAAKLDAELYEEVEADQTALNQALSVVLLSSLAAGIGTGFHGGLGALFTATLGALISWFAWAFLAFVIGTKLLPEETTQSDMGELLRTIGFSSSPGLIRALGIIPGLNALLVPVASIWMLVAMVVAVRQALDYSSTGRAIGVCLIGWIVQVFILALFFKIAGVQPQAL